MFEWAATMLSQGSTTGAIDVVAVRDSQGNLSCSPFHVKLNKPAQKGDCCRIVKLTVNSKDVALSMKIGSAGEAFFVERTNLKSLSRNPVHPVTNSSGFEQGTTPKNTALQIPQQHSLFVTAEVNGNTTRRRQRSFSDGDIDGDYKYLLDEQVIMALSLCAPVSFHHEKDTDCSDSSSLKQDKVSVSLTPNKESKGTDCTEVASLVAPLSSSSPAFQCNNATFTTAFGKHDEDVKEVENDSDLPKRVRSVSDTQESRGTYERDSKNQSQIPTVSDGHMNDFFGMKSFGSKPPVSSIFVPPLAVTLAPKVLPPASVISSNSGTGSCHETSNQVKPFNSSNPQEAVAEKMPITEVEVTRSTAIRVAPTPPSWSWTWGALPVKSKTKSSTDVITEDRQKDADACVPVIFEDVRSDASGSNVIDAIDHREVLPVCVSSCAPISETVVNADNECHNMDSNTEVGAKDGNLINTPAGCQNICSEDAKSVMLDECPSTLDLKTSEPESESDSQHPMTGSASTTDDAVMGEPKHVNAQEEKAVIAKSAEASMSMSEAHRSHSDSHLASKVSRIESEIVGLAYKPVNVSSDIVPSSFGVFAEGEVDGDGDTDQELDTLSLHDIPLDQISPEPAGGDFYDSDTESYLSLSLDDGDTAKVPPRSKFGKYRYRRVLVPSQEQLLSLDLQDGENEISFMLQRQESKGAYTSATPLLRNQLFVWPHDAKIVIIDIEGVITAINKGGKGWGMGGFLSAPRTAVHNGVAKLLTNIHNNGYRILYIAQSTSTALSTKEHLAKVGAGSDINLPPGPVFQSPDSLIKAFGAARTDLFKAAALRGLKSLFPAAHNPFYACFGTRPCDMVAFARCGVPEARIFIVSPDTGEISGMNRTYRSSYEQVNQVLHEMFPAVSDSQSRTLFFQCPSPTSAAYSSASSSRKTEVLSPQSGSAATGSVSVSQSTKSIGDPVCSLAEEDFSDFNFWKIPHVALT